MRDRELYARILGIEKPWFVDDVVLDEKGRSVEVRLEYTGDPVCPECGVSGPRYDSKKRQWQHLDTMQFKTFLTAVVPRSNCQDHGVHQVHVPWAEKGSRFTALFEAVVIDWLKEATISAVARLIGLSWGAVSGIMGRAVARGLARREAATPTLVSIDETSFRKRHHYVTIISSRGTVLYVADGRGKETVSDFFAGFTAAALDRIDTVTMDMWEPYILATTDSLPDGEARIAFDRFHVAKHLGDAVDKVRRAENKSLLADDDVRLKGTKHLWLTKPADLTKDRRKQLKALRSTRLRTARAWAIKQEAAGLWGFDDYEKAKTAWMKWYGWAIRSRLEPVKRAARMVKSHLEGILCAVMSGTSNSSAENINGRVQKVKHMAHGFRNPRRFHEAIYFHFGGLNLYPATCGLRF
jgi:transposase